jgi:diacylglycerol kinase family enzyme
MRADRTLRAMRVLLLVNATASSVTARKRVLVHKAIAAHHDVEVAQTSRRGHATKLARAASNDGFDAVVVLAGDGTLNEAADGLVGTECALGALPGGSTNVYAHTLGTPSDIVVAAEAIAFSLQRGAVQRIGVGNASGRRFLFHCGIGFDAAVIRRVERHGELKRLAPHPLYVASAFATWFRHFDRRSPGFDIEIPATGERIEGVYFAIVSKTTPYTYLGSRPIHVAPEASLDRPLALTAFTRIDVLTLIGGAASAMASGAFLRNRDGIEHRHDLVSLEVAGRSEFAWQVDGDDLGDTPDLSINYEPDCLNLLLP